MKIALLCPSRIGDFICATPAFRALKNAWPPASVTLAGLPFVHELVRRSPHLDRFEAFPGYPGIAEQFFAPDRALEFFQRMQAERFNLVIQIHGSGVYSNPVALMMGGARTAGFVRPGDGRGCLDWAMPFPERLHATERALALVEAIGVRPCGSHTEFALWPEDHARAAELLAPLDAPLAGLHIGSREPQKCWPAEKYFEIARRLEDRYTVVFIGGPEESAESARLAGALSRAVSFAGSVSLPVMGAIIDRLAFLVTNDSAPAHISYALRRPTVTLFGTTDPAVWGPPEDPRHRAVVAPRKELHNLPVDDVWNAIKEIEPDRWRCSY